MPPPSIRLASFCKYVKCSMNLRCKSVRSLAYTTCSDVPDWFPDTHALCHPLEKDGKFKVTETLCQWKRQHSSASLFARQLKESGFKHDVETYMEIVRLLCQSGMDVRLNHFFMYVIENVNRGVVGFKISDLLEALIEDKLIKAVDVLVKLYASVGRFEEAMHTLSEMKSRGRLMVSTQTYNFVMNELVEWGKVERVESVYRSNGLIPNVYTYGILIKGYCRKGRLREALDVFIEMVEAGVQPNADNFGTYIHALCSRGNADLAFQVVKKLRACNNMPIDVFAYACIIRGFVEERKLQDAENVLLDMKIGEVVPDADCYGALTLGYYHKGDTAKALNLRNEMESRGIKADNAIVRSMMQSLVGLGRLAEALNEFKHFMQSGVFLDGVTFNIAIDASCKLGRMDVAIALVKGMKVRKLKPWQMHYRTLMQGYFLQGEPRKALYIFQEMMRNGLRPDSTTYYVLARGSERCGVFIPLSMLFKHV